MALTIALEICELIPNLEENKRAYFEILKKESDIKRIYALIGVNTTVSSIMLIIATLGLFLNLWITIIAVVVSGILYFLNLYQGFNELSKVDKNHMVYAFASCYFITLFIVCYIIPKIFA